jgi:hypothetical protein
MNGTLRLSNLNGEFAEWLDSEGHAQRIALSYRAS